MALNLTEWLEWLKSLHVRQWDLSLERVTAMAVRLGLDKPTVPVVTVGGTNGKGSTVAGLEAIYLAEGCRVGAFTSPYLLDFTEQIRIMGQAVSEDKICHAFAALVARLEDLTLTPFECTALAALLLFKEANLDVILLEVGLGGRFDAVNVVSSDVAIVTSIGIDHTEWLGDTREAIGFEKAGIFRRGKPAVCGDPDPPQSLMQYAHEIGAPWYGAGREFGWEAHAAAWDWWSLTQRYADLPLPKLLLPNMATVLMAVELLGKVLPVSRQSIDRALRDLTLPGRIEVIPGRITHVLDVAHNPHATVPLIHYLKAHPIKGKTYALFAMLADKDIATTLACMQPYIDGWVTAPIDHPRGAGKAQLLAGFQKAGVAPLHSADSLDEGYRYLLSQVLEGDRIVVFGSFHTVASVKRARAVSA